MDGILQKASRYVADAAWELTKSAARSLGESVRNTISKADVSGYAAVNLNYTVGGQAAVDVKGFGVKANLGSAKMFELSGSVDNKGFAGEVDWLNKDNQIDFSQGGSLAYIVSAGGENSTVEENGGDPTGETSTTLDKGAGVPGIKGVISYEYSCSEEGTSTYTMKSGLEIGGSIGIGAVGDFSIEAGMKISIEDEQESILD